MCISTTEIKEQHLYPSFEGQMFSQPPLLDLNYFEGPSRNCYQIHKVKLLQHWNTYKMEVKKMVFIQQNGDVKMSKKGTYFFLNNLPWEFVICLV